MMNQRYSFLLRHRQIASVARALLLIGSLCAAEVLAEGAVRVLDCRLARLCDASGSCVDESGAVEFRMEPAEVAADGSGSYRLIYGDDNATMTALSSAGPFVWSVGDARHTLLASSEREFLWHQLNLRPVPDATIRFLVCTFSQ